MACDNIGNTQYTGAYYAVYTTEGVMTRNLYNSPGSAGSQSSV